MDKFPETQGLIETLKNRVLQGGDISFEEAMAMMDLESEEEIRRLQEAAHEITLHFNSQEPGLCSLVNAKSYLCGEDCGFCSQSVRFDTKVNRYQLMTPEQVLEAAKKFEGKGVENFCIVTSGGELSESEFEKMIATLKLLKKETSMNIDASLGFLTPDRAQRLKAAGLRRYNDNLQTSREFYPKIVSTHSYDKRLETLQMLKDGEMELCSGGILGMGETRADRVKLALELKPFAPHCLPMNVLNPRPGTPLEGQPKLEVKEIIKAIAVFRFIHPKANIKLSGGREVNLSMTEQEGALRGGANGLIIGGYLTTEGNPMEADMAMLKRAGYQPVPASQKSVKASPSS